MNENIRKNLESISQMLKCNETIYKSIGVESSLTYTKFDDCVQNTRTAIENMKKELLFIMHNA